MCLWPNTDSISLATTKRIRIRIRIRISIRIRSVDVDAGVSHRYKRGAVLSFVVSNSAIGFGIAPLLLLSEANGGTYATTTRSSRSRSAAANC